MQKKYMLLLYHCIYARCLKTHDAVTQSRRACTGTDAGNMISR